MPDHKYEQGNDRQRTTLDFKQRVIDLMANRQPLPDVDIYDEPVRYFKANLEWCAVIFGWLDWLEDIAGWQDAEDENHPGIQAILKFEEGIESAMPEPIDTYEAIKLGIYDAFNDLAKQIVSGRTTNISVDEDGAVSNPTDEISDEELPPNLPGTDYDESAMAKSGGASGVRLGINQIWSNLGAWYTASVTLADAQARLKYLYMLDATGSDNLVSAYYTARGASQPYVASFASTLDAYLFCKGINKQSIAEWIFEVHTANQQSLAALILDALLDEQIKDWFNRGLDAPSTDYLAYSCVPIPTYSFQITALNTLFADSRVLKKFHRYLVTVEGYWIDSDGDIQDAIWHKQVGQTEVFDTTPDLNIQISNAVKRYPTVFEAPYDGANHRYQWTIELGPNDASANWTLNRDTGTMAAGATSPTGGLSFTVKDLGEIVN